MIDGASPFLDPGFHCQGASKKEMERIRTKEKLQRLQDKIIIQKRYKIAEKLRMREEK